MSHRVDIETQIKDVEAAKRACEALNIPCRVGKHKVRLFDGSDTPCDFSMTLPNWRYPIAVNLQTGKAQFDNYNGSWGSLTEFDKFNQEYGLQVVEHQPDVQELIQQGWTAQRVQVANDVQLRLFQM